MTRAVALKIRLLTFLVLALTMLSIGSAFLGHRLKMEFVASKIRGDTLIYVFAKADSATLSEIEAMRGIVFESIDRIDSLEAAIGRNRRGLLRAQARLKSDSLTLATYRKAILILSNQAQRGR